MKYFDWHDYGNCVIIPPHDIYGRVLPDPIQRNKEASKEFYYKVKQAKQNENVPRKSK
jgi:hypothetical protein